MVLKVAFLFAGMDMRPIGMPVKSIHQETTKSKILRLARGLGNFLLVGIHTDQIVTYDNATSISLYTHTHMYMDKYDGYLVEKCGDERSKHLRFDEDLWSRAAGSKNKGKVYGLSNVNDFNTLGKKDPKNEKLNEIIKEILKEKEEKERLNGIIAELDAEKENH
ncbi:hypothetical protein R6Q59_001652 [Mikania micrantha]